jgi:hypothetical protein
VTAASLRFSAESAEPAHEGGKMNSISYRTKVAAWLSQIADLPREALDERGRRVEVEPMLDPWHSAPEEESPGPDRIEPYMERFAALEASENPGVPRDTEENSSAASIKGSPALGAGDPGRPLEPLRREIARPGILMRFGEDPAFKIENSINQENLNKLARLMPKDLGKIAKDRIKEFGIAHFVADSHINEDIYLDIHNKIYNETAWRNKLEEFDAKIVNDEFVRAAEELIKIFTEWKLTEETKRSAISFKRGVKNTDRITDCKEVVDQVAMLKSYYVKKCTAMNRDVYEKGMKLLAGNAPEMARDIQERAAALASDNTSEREFDWPPIEVKNLHPFDNYPLHTNLNPKNLERLIASAPEDIKSQTNKFYKLYSEFLNSSSTNRSYLNRGDFIEALENSANFSEASQAWSEKCQERLEEPDELFDSIDAAVALIKKYRKHLDESGKSSIFRKSPKDKISDCDNTILLAEELKNRYIKDRKYIISEEYRIGIEQIKGEFPEISPTAAAPAPSADQNIADVHLPNPEGQGAADLSPPRPARKKPQLKVRNP